MQTTVCVNSCKHNNEAGCNLCLFSTVKDKNAEDKKV